MSILLQSGPCAAGSSVFDYVINFEFIKAITCPYANAAGFAVTALLVYGAISLVVYIRTDSLVVPFILLVVTGGAVLTQLPAVSAPIAVVLLLGVPAGIMALGYYLYDR